MAIQDLASIGTVLTKYFANDITSSINRAVVLAQILPKRMYSGSNIQWVARLGTPIPAGAVIADGADVSTFNSDTKKPAVLQYGTYNDSFSISGKALAAAFRSPEPAALQDLFGEEILESVERLSMAIGNHFYTGTGIADTIHGITAPAGGVSATGVYAGIDRAVDAQWAASEVDAAAAALSFDLMRSVRTQIYIASGKKPDVILCGPAAHEKYGALFGNERRYVQDVRIRGEVIRLDGGYQVLEFDGIPVIEDINAPADTMVFLNTKEVHCTQLADGPSFANGSPGMVGLHGTPEEALQGGSTGLVARINKLAKTGDAHKIQLICYPQIVVKTPNTCGKLINFT